MKLSILLKDLTTQAVQHDRDISGLSLDSRTTKSGDLFIACQHGAVDGREFIQEAIKKGACSVLVEAEGDNSEILLRNSVSIVPILNLKFKISEIAARFYQAPAQAMRLVGITGTSGKSSCAYFVADALQQINLPCGVIDGIDDAIEIQKQLAEFLKKKTKIAAITLSSNSITQGDINSVEFAVNIVTNFSLGETVLETVDTAIKSLCERAKFAVVNLDDDLGFQLLSSATEANKIFAYSINEPALQKKTHDAVEKIYVENVRLDMTGIHANVVSPWGSGELQTQLLGRFNLSNILASLTTLCLLEIPFEKVLHCMSHLKSAPGRMQVLGGRTQPLVVVDSAKSPESLEKILFALREHCHRKLYCVFGCDGDTDQERRSLMGMIAEMYADHIVVTSDNPGDVDALEIIADIQRGFSEPKHVVIEMDRTKAIRDVIKQAVVGDCILVAGKGVEVYQVVGDEKISFSDVEIINEVLDH